MTVQRLYVFVKGVYLQRKYTTIFGNLLQLHLENPIADLQKVKLNNEMREPFSLMYLY